MASGAETRQRATRLVQTGLDAVTTAVEKLPGVVRKASRRDGTGKNTKPSEYVIVEDLPDAIKKCYLVFAREPGKWLCL